MKKDDFSHQDFWADFFEGEALKKEYMDIFYFSVSNKRYLMSQMKKQMLKVLGRKELRRFLKCISEL